ncbi:hypothetical protein K1719_002772 [Acacia pycnantha]|nr:hypothetical protein K1719_014458 [Acacia pycnantha]KAI9126351.1 hypothetical protein K1719_002772 [Acacia pycnantha]
MAKKRKSTALSLDEVDRTMYASFCSATNSLSQLYIQAMNHRKLSFQAGECHGLTAAQIQHESRTLSEENQLLPEIKQLNSTFQYVVLGMQNVHNHWWHLNYLEGRLMRPFRLVHTILFGRAGREREREEDERWLGAQLRSGWDQEMDFLRCKMNEESREDNIKVLTSGGDDGTVRLWSRSPTGKRGQCFKGYTLWT